MVLVWIALCSGTVLLPAAGHAASPTISATCTSQAAGQVCACATDLEPTLFDDSNSTAPAAGMAGFDIVNAVFSTINDIMATMEETFYNNIIGAANSPYQNAINALVILYVTVYGILILFSMAPARANEVVARLTKIGLLYMFVSPGGFTNFQNCVSNPVLNTINDMITQFSAAGNGGAGISVMTTGATQACGSATAGQPAGGTLSSAAMDALLGPMTLVFSTTFAVSLIALLSTPTGWFMALAIIWATVEFLFMLIGALITYIKGIVGLAFLFALAPIFLAFILFAKTKQIFFGWVNQVMGFFLTPILLFAFLGFYSNLLLSIMQSALFPTAAMNPTVGDVNYCWVTWFHWTIIDIHWWRPVDEYVQPGSTAWNQEPNSCTNLCSNGGDWVGPPAVGIVQVLYFLLLTHLGKNLSGFIEQMAKDISGGTTPGVVRGDTVGRWFSAKFLGGRGPGSIAKDFAAGAVGVAKGAAGGAGKAFGTVGKRGGMTLASAILHPKDAAKTLIGGALLAKDAAAAAPANAGRVIASAARAAAGAPGKAAKAAKDTAKAAVKAPGTAAKVAGDKVVGAVRTAAGVPGQVAAATVKGVEAVGKMPGAVVEGVKQAPGAAVGAAKKGYETASAATKIENAALDRFNRGTKGSSDTRGAVGGTGHSRTEPSSTGSGSAPRTNPSPTGSGSSSKPSGGQPGPRQKGPKFEWHVPSPRKPGDGDKE